MGWENETRWHWRTKRVTVRDYPAHGTDTVQGGKLTGSTSTDYFHFDCPRCGKAQEWGLDVELLGVRDDSDNQKHLVQTVLLGIHCPLCGLMDLIKIGCLQNVGYQPRRIPQST